MLKNLPWTSFLELIITIGIGFLVKLVFEKPDLAFLIWFIGILLFLHRILLGISFMNNNREVYETLNEVKQINQSLSSLVDLDKESKTFETDQIRKLYISITEPEFQEIKNEIITDAVLKLENLLHNKETEELTSSMYYDWIFKVFDRTSKGDSIKAVSIMDSLEWDENDPNEVKFFEANVSAAKRGVKLERIFVMNKELLNSALENTFIKAQEKNNTNKINGYFADKELIHKTDKGLLKNIGYGFIIVNDKVVLIDVFSEDGIARGMVVMKETVVKSFITTFDRLKNSSTDLEKIVD